MKINLLSIFLFLFSGNLLASELVDKVIYGDDDRTLLGGYNPSIHPKYELSGRSVLAQVEKWRVYFKDNGDVGIAVYDFKKTYKMCEEESFLNRPIVSNCTAFLVAPDVIFTAGHCVLNQKACSSHVWVFDYNESTHYVSEKEQISFKKENVFYCKELIKSFSDYKSDYAIIKLDRQATLRAALKLRKEGEIGSDDKLFVIGHPMGLPQVLAKNITVRKNINPNNFLTVADTFTGNSGSPVINEATNLVEGILIRGNEDLVPDQERSCNQVIRCSLEGCRGETVQRILKVIP